MTHPWNIRGDNGWEGVPYEEQARDRLTNGVGEGGSTWGGARAYCSPWSDFIKMTVSLPRSVSAIVPMKVASSRSSRWSGRFMNSGDLSYECAATKFAYRNIGGGGGEEESGGV